MSEPDPGLLRAEVPRSLAGTRFDRALRELFPDLSGSQLQRLVRAGKVKLEGEKVFRSNFKLRGGERVAVRVAPPAEPKRDVADLEFLHDEEAYAIVNKPPGMLTHPNEKQSGGTVSDLVVERFGPLPSVEGDARPGIVHRLDRETSGILVIARTRPAMKELRRQFRDRLVTKSYVALVHGVPEADEFEVGAPLGPVPGHMDLQRVDPRGKPAHTRFRVARRLEDHAILECWPTTGRRHQIRVHLAHAGHPVVGDKLYRPQGGSPRTPGVWHHMLHAESLEFDVPGSDVRVRWAALLPPSFLQLLDTLANRP